MLQRQIKQQGNALIIALFVMTLVGLLAASIYIYQKNTIARLQSITTNQQYDAYQQYATAWAMHMLREQLKQPGNQQAVDNLYQPWHQPMPTFQQNDWVVNAQLEDWQGRFALNNLQITEETNAPTVTQAQLARLIESATEGVQDATAITAAIASWINTTSQGGNTLSQDVPYYIPHLPFSSISELRLIPSVTPELYLALAPLVNAIPGQKQVIPVNVNTGNAKVLAAITGISESQMQQVIDARPFADMASFKSTLQKVEPSTTALTLDEYLGVGSSYFLLITTIKHQQQQRTIFTLLNRRPDASLWVIWQDWELL